MVLDNVSLHTSYSETPAQSNKPVVGNCSSSNITESFGACSNSTSSVLYDIIDIDAFAYIFVVLSFYAVSMVLLMIKYIKREEEEVCLSYYYTEFVKREKFQNPIYKNKVALQNATTSGLIDKALQILHASDGSKLGTYRGISEDEGRSLSPGQTSRLHSSVSRDLPVDNDSGPSSEVRVDSSEDDDDDILCEHCPDDNILETIV